MIDVHVYVADMIRAKDGDTVELLVDTGFGDYMKASFRLNDIDTGETTWRAENDAEKQHGREALTRLVELVENQEQPRKPLTFLQKYHKLKNIELPNTGLVIRSAKHGKYRWLVTLYPMSALELNNIEDATSFNQIMIDEGYQKRESYEAKVES